jgi:hypothetical protein
VSTDKCKECGELLMPVESGLVCPNGHGKLILHSHTFNEDLDDDLYLDDDDEDFDDFGFDDEEEDEYDRALDECGQLPKHLGGGCTLAGTEHCDFDCPFHDIDLSETSEEEE